MCLDAFCLYIKNDIMDMNVHGKTFFFLAFFVLIGKPRPNTIEWVCSDKRCFMGEKENPHV